MFAALLTLARPFLGYILGAVAIASVAGGLYFKIRHDAKAELLVKIEQEKRDAIDKAKAARERIRALCDADPTKCVPADWFRDD